MPTSIGWFSHCLRHYAQFSGRASRREYWWFQAVVWIVNLILHMLGYEIPLVAGILTIIWNFGVVIPHLAVASRRLHDSGQSFWWIVPPIGGWALLAIGAVVRGHGSAASIGGLLLILLLAWLGVVAGFVYLLCKPGNDGLNRYGGPAPTAPN